jgi:hypothetical protein
LSTGRGPEDERREGRRGDGDPEPRQRERGVEDARHDVRRPAALGDLLEPRVLGRVGEAVGDLQAEVEADEEPELACPHPASGRHEEEGGQREQHAVHAVVVAEVDGRADADDLPGQEGPPEKGDAVEVEAELGGEPRDGEQEERDRERGGRGLDPHPLAGEVGREGEEEGERDPRRGERVHRPRVEVVLVDYARPEHHRAEVGRDHRGAERKRPPAEAIRREGDHRQRRQRDREVQEDERAAEAGFDARAADRVELLRRDPRVRDDDLGGDEAEQRPQCRDGGDLTGALAVVGQLSLPAATIYTR